MPINTKALKNAEDFLKGTPFPLKESDPELFEIFVNFTFGDVVEESDIPARTRALAILATLVGSGAEASFRAVLTGALNNTLTAFEVREVVYQAVSYLGLGRALPFIGVMNSVFKAAGISVPLADAGVAKTPAERAEKGEAAQVEIFGDVMKNFRTSGPAETVHINRFLVDNCFGDYYTRGHLNLAEREMITFCFLLSQGGCEPQLKGHVHGNIRIGNDKAFLIKIVTAVMPFIGYPRTLNALTALSEAAAEV